MFPEKIPSNPRVGAGSLSVAEENSTAAHAWQLPDVAPLNKIPRLVGYD